MLEHRADGRHLEHRDRLVQRRGDRLRPHRGGQRAGDLMSDIARMPEVIGVGNDLAREGAR